MPLTRPDPIYINGGEEATAAVIFMHGVGDDGESFRGMSADQFVNPSPNYNGQTS